MSIFGAIVDRIFHHSTATAAGNQTAQAGGGTASAQSAQAPGQHSQATGQQAQSPGSMGTQGQPQLQTKNNKTKQTQQATTKDNNNNRQTTNNDLLKLLDLDSSLTARKTLASELNEHAGADGTAEQNIALQKAVWAKLAANGGRVPDSLRS